LEQIRSLSYLGLDMLARFGLTRALLHSTIVMSSGIPHYGVRSIKPSAK
jgi:hypothetical protein